MWKWFKKKEDKSTIMEEESEDRERTFRERMEVGKRILALLAVIGKVHDDNPQFNNWFERNKIEEYLSEKEKTLWQSENPSKEELIKFSWRAEALTSLLWAAKMIENMPGLNKQYNIFSNPKVLEILKNPESFLNTIELRNEKEIEEMEEELYEQHWRVRDAQLFKKPMPNELAPSIVYERRYGLSWIVGWGEDWDHVPTDT
ncbi:MAG: DUF4272 domain-containing protein [Crocinitomicaceae bacterium]|nr:DUF4272 domain-containing protein [Crocinitomicaceae bacterium]